MSLVRLFMAAFGATSTRSAASSCVPGITWLYGLQRWQGTARGPAGIGTAPHRQIAGHRDSKGGIRSYFIATRAVATLHRYGNLNENSIFEYARRPTIGDERKLIRSRGGVGAPVLTNAATATVLAATTNRRSP